MVSLITVLDFCANIFFVASLGCRYWLQVAIPFLSRTDIWRFHFERRRDAVWWFSRFRRLRQSWFHHARRHWCARHIHYFIYLLMEFRYEYFEAVVYIAFEPRILMSRCHDSASFWSRFHLIDINIRRLLLFRADIDEPPLPRAYFHCCATIRSYLFFEAALLRCHWCLILRAAPAAIATPFPAMPLKRSFTPAICILVNIW